MEINKANKLFSKIDEFEIDGEYNDMEMEFEVQYDEMKLEDDQLDMYIDDIKEERERTKHNDQTNDVKIAIDIDCIDDIMGETDSAYAKEYNKKVKILTKKGKIELMVLWEK